MLGWMGWNDFGRDAICSWALGAEALLEKVFPTNYLYYMKDEDTLQGIYRGTINSSRLPTCNISAHVDCGLG